MTQGDLAEFTEFYSANFHRIAGQLYAYLGDQAEAQDIAQEAFCRALDRWDRVSGYAHAVAWVRQVAWNLATSRLRHLQVAMRHLVRQRVEHVDGPNPDRVALTRALATLPPNHRLAVVLHHLGHLSVAEIAEQRGVAEGTVRSWLSRGRSQLAEYFVEEQEPEWNTMTTRAFRQQSVGTMASTVSRRRRVRRSALAAALVLALAVPLGIVLRERGDEPPIIGPTTPPVSPSPSPVLPVRTVALPGVEITGPGPRISFVDRLHAWMLYEPCQGQATDPVDCRPVLAATRDGGKTWRRVRIPPFGENAAINLYPLGPDTLTLFVLERADAPVEPEPRYLFTDDGGETFTWFSDEDVPAAGQIANRGRYQLLCPGANGFEDGARGTTCERAQLVRIGSGPVSPQPPMRDRDTTNVLNGADGRLWIIDYGPPPRVMVSDDAKSWRELPSLPPDAGQGHLLSPDGAELWWFGEGRLLSLIDGAWRERVRTSAPEHGGWAPIGGGAVVISDGGHVKIWSPDGVTEVPEVPPGYVSVLDDATIVVRAQAGVYLGLGTGTDREWITLRW